MGSSEVTVDSLGVMLISGSDSEGARVGASDGTTALVAVGSLDLLMPEFDSTGAAAVGASDGATVFARHPQDKSRTAVKSIAIDRIGFIMHHPISMPEHQYVLTENLYR